jgi:hypothetical protein
VIILSCFRSPSLSLIYISSSVLRILFIFLHSFLFRFSFLYCLLL